MNAARDDRIARLMACPVCRVPLVIQRDDARCPGCSRVFPRRGTSWHLLRDEIDTPLPRHESAFFGTWQRLRQTPAGRLYSSLYVHPSRFIGDLQAGGTTNYHRRLGRFLDGLAPDAVVVDVGSGARRLRSHVITLDLQPGPLVDLVADAHRLPLITEGVDAIVVQQVLEHVKDPTEVVAEVFRVLRPGGRVYAEVPFLYPVHDAYDFRRWTVTGLQLLFEGFRPRETGVAIGPGSALSAILRRAAVSPLRHRTVEAAVDLLLGWLLAPLKFLDEIAARWPGADLVAGAVFYEGQKP